MTKEPKTSAESQALFDAELAKLSVADKLKIQPVASNARLTSSVFEAGAGKVDATSPETDQDAIDRLQDRYDRSDEP
ncbi:hypothetical protein [Beijerinckia sp. L45]|uniref:hypothetical protein n=1 Tax=Beijerinckia sp. L45 TaxID=1641855 RepID=UPI00131DAFF6|nr:hypothetical protein [Beijerinckia sp. L45]